MTINDLELAKIAREAIELFFLPAFTDSLLAPLQELIPKVPPLFSQGAEAFCTSVRSIESMAGLPYRFALAASEQRRYQSFSAAADIRAILDSLDSGELQRAYVARDNSNKKMLEDVARDIANKNMREFAGSSEGRAALNFDACRQLLDLAKTTETADAATQLLLQTTVLTWGALEVLSREIFRSYLNRMPTAYANLMADSDIRKRFELSRISIEKIADFGFNLCGRLGDLLVEQNDLSDLPGMKAAFCVLFPEDSRLRDVLSDRILWILFQRRNLIVHRRGIIDARYIAATGEELPLGSQLRVRPADVESYLELVARAAHALVSIGLGMPSVSEESGIRIGA